MFNCSLSKWKFQTKTCTANLKVKHKVLFQLPEGGEKRLLYWSWSSAAASQVHVGVKIGRASNACFFLPCKFLTLLFAPDFMLMGKPQQLSSCLQWSYHCVQTQGRRCYNGIKYMFHSGRKSRHLNICSHSLSELCFFEVPHEQAIKLMCYCYWQYCYNIFANHTM